MIAKPGDSNYSRLSVMLSYCTDIEKLLEVSKDDFYPNPKISSAIIKLTPHTKVVLDKFIIKVSRALFQHKKKKTRNALQDSFHEIADMDKKTVKKLINQLNTKMMEKRVVKLEPNEILEISNQLKLLMEP